MMVSFVLSFFPRDVLDEILNLIESVSEDFPSYSYGLKLKCLDCCESMKTSDWKYRMIKLSGQLLLLDKYLHLDLTSSASPQLSSV